METVHAMQPQGSFYSGGGRFALASEPKSHHEPAMPPNRTTFSDMRATGEGVYARHLAADQALSYDREILTLRCAIHTTRYLYLT